MKTKCTSFKRDKNIYLNMKYNNNLVINLIPLDIEDLIVEETEIFGSTGKITIDSNFYINYYKLYRSKDFSNLFTYKLKKREKSKIHYSIRNIYKNISDNLKNNNIKLLSDSINSIDVINFMKKVI